MKPLLALLWWNDANRKHGNLFYSGLFFPIKRVSHNQTFLAQNKFPSCFIATAANLVRLVILETAR